MWSLWICQTLLLLACLCSHHRWWIRITFRRWLLWQLSLWIYLTFMSWSTCHLLTNLIFVFFRTFWRCLKCCLLFLLLWLGIIQLRWLWAMLCAVFTIRTAEHTVRAKLLLEFALHLPLDLGLQLSPLSSSSSIEHMVILILFFLSFKCHVISNLIGVITSE